VDGRRCWGGEVVVRSGGAVGRKRGRVLAPVGSPTVKGNWGEKK